MGKKQGAISDGLAVLESWLLIQLLYSVTGCERKLRRRRGQTQKALQRETEWACDPSSHRFGQGGLHLISLNSPPAAVAFPQLINPTSPPRPPNSTPPTPREPTGRGVRFQGQSVCGGRRRALEIVGYLVCNLISTPPLRRAPVNLIFCL